MLHCDTDEPKWTKDMGGFSSCLIRILVVFNFILLQNLVSFENNSKSFSNLSETKRKIMKNIDTVVGTGISYNGKEATRDMQLKMNLGLWFLDVNESDEGPHNSDGPELMSERRKRSNSYPQRKRGQKRKSIRPIGTKDKQESNTDVSENQLKEMAAESYGDPCITEPCDHGGTCLWKKNHVPSFVCQCALGYTGSRCRDALPECDEGPCEERGDCVATRRGFVCVCKDGYRGKYCEVRNINTKESANKPKQTIKLVLTKEELQTGEYVTAAAGGTILVLAIILIVHCCRVNIRRTRERIAMEQQIADGKMLTSLPSGLFDVSNQLCLETFCCSNSESKKRSSKDYSNLKQIRSKKRRGRHYKNISQESVWKSPIKHQITPSRIERFHEHWPSAQRQVQSERYLSECRPNIPPFRNMPTTVHYPEQRFSWIDNHLGKDPRYTESSRLLPRQQQTHGSYDEVADDIIKSQIINNEFECQINDANKPFHSENSIPQYDKHMFSQHTIHSEPSRNHPPLPPPPPPFPPGVR